MTVTCLSLQFKESALRKQSLYLKFDPLLKDSPRRPVPVAPETNRYSSPQSWGFRMAIGQYF